MIRIAQEDFAGWHAEGAPLFRAHWEEVGTFRDAVPLDVDVERIIELERAGLWLSWTVRDAGVLVGYVCVLVTPHLHYRSTPQAFVDVVYLVPAVRGGGLGRRVLRQVMDALGHAGVRKIVLHVKLSHDFGPLLEQLGFVATETNYERLL